MKKFFLSSKYLLLLVLFVSPFLVCAYNEQSPFEMIKMITLCIGTLIAGALFSISFIKGEDISLRWNTALSFLATVLAATTLSYYFSNNRFDSFWGNNNIPSDSLLTVMVFFLFCFLLTQLFENFKDLLKLNFVLLGSAFLLGAYGVIQHFGYDPIDWWGYKQMHLNAYGTIGQAVGYASILGSIFPLAVVSYFAAQEKFKRRFLALLIFLMLLGIMYSGSRMPMLVTLGLSFILSGFFAFKNRSRENIKKALAVIGLIVLSQIAYYGEPSTVTSAMTQKLRPQVVSSGLQERIQVWKDAVKIWEKYPYLGTGPEHFALELKLVNTKDFNTNQNWGLYWHKAHNHIVHYLATIGIIGLLSHLLVAGFVFFSLFQFLRKEKLSDEDLIRLGYLFGFSGIFLANMTAFNFVMTQLYSVIFPVAYSISYFEKARVLELRTPRFLNIINIVLLCTLFVLFSNELFRYWKADNYFSRSRRSLEAEKNMAKAIEYIDLAIATKDNDCRFYLRKASLMTSIFKYQARANPGLDLAPALRELDLVTSQGVNCDPKNSENWFYRARLFSDLFESRIEPTIDRAEQGFIEGTKYSPANPVFPYNLGLLYMVAGRNTAFINRMQDAIDLKADYMLPYQRLYEYYYAQKNRAEIDKLTARIASLGFISGESLGEMLAVIEIAKRNGDEKTVSTLSEIHSRFYKAHVALSN